jgi:adenosylmethionine---8-amino-7-oxononanoate aminotransferase
MQSNYSKTGMSDLSAKDKNMIWHPYSQLEAKEDNIVINSAKGIYLHTSDGRKIMDAVSSWWVNIHGHAHPYLAEALLKQALELEHVIFAGFTHKPAIEFAERLLGILPDQQRKIFYSDNGSTAVEVALKMAMQFWHNQKIEKKKIVALEGAYHGDTFGAMSVSGRSSFTNAFSPFLFDVQFISFPSKEKEKESLEEFAVLAESGEVAAFIYEPLIQGTSGMRIYSKEILESLLLKAKKHNVLCIADEVMTGFGRTGKLFASQYLHGQPDIMCLSKGITGGTMPFGVTSCNEKVTSAFRSEDKSKTLFHGHSYTANPLACAVSNASLDLLLKEECMRNIKEIENDHLAFCEKIKNHKNTIRVQCLGTILSIELLTSEDAGYFNKLRDYCYNFFLNQDILMRPLGNVIYILPPYVISKKERDKIYKAIIELLNSLQSISNV